MTQHTKLIGLFIIVADDGTIPLSSKTLPYILASEPSTSFGGYVKIAEVEVAFTMPSPAAIAEAMRSKLLADKANLVEESAARIAALDGVLQTLTPGTAP
jgi:hypothetical protein